MADGLVKRVLDRAQDLRAKRYTFASHWMECREVLAPESKTMFGYQTPGAKRHRRVLDNTGELAAERLATALYGALSAPGTRWFEIGLADGATPSAALGAWLTEITKRLHALFNAPESGWAGAMAQTFLMLVVYGTAALYMRDRPGKVPRWMHWPLGETAIAADGDGVVDTVYRTYQMPLRTALNHFGHEALGKGAFEDGKNNPEKLTTIIQGIEPRKDGQLGAIHPRQRPVGSAWVSVEYQHEIKQSGFFELPCVTPRWFVEDPEVYSRSRGMKALPFVNMLQRVMLAQIRGMEVTIKPPLMVAGESLLSQLNTGSGTATTVDPDLMVKMRGDPIRAIKMGARPDYGVDGIEMIRQDIRDAFFWRLIQTLDDPRATATQIIELKRDKLIELAPYTGRLQTELLGPMVALAYQTAVRNRWLPEPPEDMNRRRIEVVYKSPLVEAQELEDVASIARFVDLSQRLVDQQENVADNLDGDAAYRAMASGMTAVRGLLRANDEVRALRETRSQAMADERQKQDVIEGAQAAAQVIPAVTNAAAADDARAAA